MRERIKKHLEQLEAMRDDALGAYLESLNDFTVKKGSMAAIECVGILHDLDKHITNLNLELKRLEVTDGQ